MDVVSNIRILPRIEPRPACSVITIVLFLVIKIKVINYVFFAEA